MERIALVAILCCLLLSGCYSSYSKEYKNIISQDGDVFIYYDKVMINQYVLYDTLKINIDPSAEKGTWIPIVSGYIKRFAYQNGSLFVEFYDKWYTFNVDDYIVGSNNYELHSYNTEAEFEHYFPDWQSFHWKKGSFIRSDENIAKEHLSDEFKESKILD